MPKTFYEYDDDGRLVSSWTESEWSEEDVDMLIAHDIVERNTGRFGEWLPEATSDGADPTNYTSGWGYRPTGPHLNWAEKVEKDAFDAHRKQAGEDANLNGVYFAVERYEFPVDPT